MNNTRHKDSIYLLNHKIVEINGCKLPSILQSLGLFLHQHLDLNMTRREASVAVINTVMKFWDKARIPTRAVQHCQQKLEDLFDKWRALKKNRGRNTETQRKNEADFINSLDDLFDIAHSDALQLIKIPEDVDFLLAQREKGRRGSMVGVDMKLRGLEMRRAKRKVEEEERHCRSKSESFACSSTAMASISGSETEDKDEDGEISDDSEDKNSHGCTYLKRGLRGRKSIITAGLTAALDRSKVSDRKAMIIVSETAKSLGHNISDLALNRQSIRISRQKHRKMLAEQVRASFITYGPIVVHWDGKILKDLTGYDHVDRLPVIVTGNNMSQLLTVAKMPSATGQAQAKAVCDALVEWGLEDKVIGMCFDTTSSNTGCISGACVRIQQTLGRNLLFLACRHHIFELVIGAVFVKCMGVSDGPVIPIFKRFKSQWHTIRQEDYEDAASDDKTLKQLIDIKDHIIQFIQDHLSHHQPRDDYREMLQLCLIFLGIKQQQGVRFKAPGAMHLARWMAKVIYTMKIWMFRSQFHLTPKEEQSTRDICIFTVRIYLKAWFTAPLAALAPAHDFQLIKDLVAYEVVNPQIAKVAAQKFSSHLWYLSEELILMSLFDDSISVADKQAIVTAIHESSLSEDEPPKKAYVDLATIGDRQLSSFVSKQSLALFHLLQLSPSFLEANVSSWKTNDNYNLAKIKVCSLTVVNDHAERGVALIQEFNGLLTKDEDQLQFALQVIQEHRKKFPDQLKRTMSDH